MLSSQVSVESSQAEEEDILLSEDEEAPLSHKRSFCKQSRLKGKGKQIRGDIQEEETRGSHKMRRPAEWSSLSVWRGQRLRNPSQLFSGIASSQPCSTFCLPLRHPVLVLLEESLVP